MTSLNHPKSSLQIFEEILNFWTHKPVEISIIDHMIFVKLESKDKSASDSDAIQT
ncbi:hypothetical protein myaer87_33770 [Microcystis aeruginosa NIES-87]|nr:hypothetical protein myaer87_33770 [Microcystis aeruginosa NIES-87]